ncbi:MAG: 30S ribosomal protein S15 [Bdellovibrionota bacterium]|nr:30S ribosomal protein S15 [Pseudobdellovibrionaceae bacterium]MEC9283967.1 30S ribosomal protein S15 [Bdellovibrionota bacterium]
MAVTKQRKEEIIAKFGLKAGDTGSPEVQVALMTERILDLNDHFKSNKQDKHSRRGLIGLVNKRRKLLEYLKGKDLDRYQKTIQELGLRK